MRNGNVHFDKIVGRAINSEFQRLSTRGLRKKSSN